DLRPRPAGPAGPPGPERAAAGAARGPGGRRLRRSRFLSWCDIHGTRRTLVKTEIQYGPAFAAATVTLDQGEGIKAEAGAMLAMSSTITLETSTQGGMMKGLRRAVLGQESFFMNTFTAQAPGSQIHLAPSLPGDMVAWTLQGQSLFVQSGSYVASAIGVDVDTSWGGARTFFSREGLYVLKVGG